MGKYEERKLTLIDLIQGIKAPAHDFLGIVQYVENHVSKHFEEDTSQYEQVKKECKSLLDSVNRSDYSSDILEIINKFTKTFNLFECRLQQVLYKLPSDKDVQVIDEVTVWFNIIYRVGIQAIIHNYNQRHEVDDNYDFFKSQLPELMKEHEGEFVLIRDKKFIEYFSDCADAYWYAREKFSDRIYSIQEITEQPVILRNVGNVLA